MNSSRRITLRRKVLIFTVGIVAAMMALSLVVVRKYVADHAYQQVSEDLRNTQSVFEAIMDDRARWLSAQCEVVAHDPRFVSTLDIPSANFDLHRTTVIREARRFQSIIGSEVFLATDRKGRVLGRLDVLTAPEQDLGQTPTVAAALEGAPYSGALVIEGQTYQAATVPISEGGRVLGTLSLGFTESQDLRWLVDMLEGASAATSIREPIASGDLIKISALTRQILIDADCDLVAITDADGRALSVAVRGTSYGEDLSSSKEIQVPLEGGRWSGLRTEQGRIVQMVTVPVWSQGEIVGALGTGFAVGDRLARHLRAMMQGEVSFAAGGSLIASTWPEAEREELAVQLFNPAGLYADQKRPFEMAVGGETYLSLMGELRGGQGEVQGFYLIQFSLDRAMAFLHTLQRALITIGLIVLLAGAVIGYVCVVRITRPIRVPVASAAGTGDSDHG